MGLTGPIPSQIGNLHMLQDMLHFSNNKLTGQIPSQIGLLADTFTGSLGLDHNRLKGDVPSELGLFAKVHQITLQSNDLSGSLPSSVCSLNNQTKISIDCPQL